MEEKQQDPLDSVKRELLEAKMKEVNLKTKLINTLIEFIPDNINVSTKPIKDLLKGKQEVKQKRELIEVIKIIPEEERLKYSDNKRK